MADVYIGKTALDTNFGPKGVTSILYTKYSTGKEYIVQDPDRVKNIRYLDGVRPKNDIVQMRLRMPLIYATTAKNAPEIIKNQKIPAENRQDIIGYGHYLWENVPDAKRYSKKREWNISSCRCLFS